MKKVVSIIVCKNIAEIPTEPEAAEILYTEENRGFAEIVQNGLKQAKGKYVLLCDGGFELTNADGLLSVAGASNADIIVFDGATALKTTLFKGFAPNGDRATAEILAVLAAKSIEKSNIKPFTLANEREADKYLYSEQTEKELANALREFKKCKSRLPKDVYTYAVDIICLRLTYYYAAAMLAVKSKAIPLSALTDFDALLKENVVLYLAMDKRFTPANLGKLRKNGFAISFLTAKKLEKFLRK